MNYSFTTKTQLLDFIRNKISVEDFDKPISMVFKPKTGWKFEVIIPVTEVSNDNDIIWISNAFSNERPRLTMQQLMSKLLEYDNETPVWIEVYGYNGKINDQFIYSKLNSIEDIEIKEINNIIYFWIKIDEIATYPS